MRNITTRRVAIESKGIIFFCSLLPASCSPLPNFTFHPFSHSPFFLLPFLLPLLVAASGCRFWLPLLLPLLVAASGCRFAAQNDFVIKKSDHKRNWGFRNMVLFTLLICSQLHNLVSIRKPRIRDWQFPSRKRSIFRLGKERTCPEPFEGRVCAEAYMRPH